MKNILKLTFILVTMCSFSKKPVNNDTANTHKHLYNTELQDLENKIEQITRDQLNYKIEKDLLKESYSTNYDRINITITIILLFFTALGIFGFKSITDIKKDFNAELQSMRETKGKMENEIVQLNRQKRAFNKSIDEIKKTNTEQDFKLQLVELKEKIALQVRNRNFNRANEYISITIEKFPNDIEVLIQKSYVSLKLKMFQESLNALNKILSNTPNDPWAIASKAEVFLIIQNLDSYNAIVATNSNELNLYNTNIFVFFESVKFMLQNQTTELKAFVTNYLNDKPDNILKKYVDFDFTDLRDSFVNVQNQQNKNIILTFISFLEGQCNKQTLLNLLGT